MSDRHQELRRQYELLRGHLAWLEKEIAREESMTSPRQEKAGVVRHPDPAPMAAPVTADADTLLNNYAGTERHDPKALKQGCLLAFAIVMGLIMVIVTAVYFVFYAHR